jgi:hypothetical protein
MEIGICKLCHQEKELCNSHIFPEFCYENIYDRNPRRFLEYSNNQKMDHKYYQKGIREHLLCRDCENILSINEKYFKENVFNETLDLKSDNNTHKYIIVDYQKTKLFLLSILWRMGISSLTEFRFVRLANHEEIIRNMILTGNPGEEYQYGCLILRDPDIKRSEIFEHSISSPSNTDLKIDGHRFCVLPLAGIFFVFIISSHTNKFQNKDFFLKKDGRMPIMFDSSLAATTLNNNCKTIKNRKNIQGNL